MLTDHLSRLELEDKDEDDEIPINETFPDEYLMVVNSVKKESWYGNIINFLAFNTYPKNMTYQQRKKLRSDSKFYFWE